MLEVRTPNAIVPLPRWEGLGVRFSLAVRGAPFVPRYVSSRGQMIDEVANPRFRRQLDALREVWDGQRSWQEVLLPMRKWTGESLSQMQRGEFSHIKILRRLRRGSNG